MEYNAHWFASDLEEPYKTPDDKPFSWQGRLRVIGGRTISWGRQTYRLSDLDFKARSHDGYGDDWPISSRRRGACTTTRSRSFVGSEREPRGRARGAARRAISAADGHELRRAAPAAGA